MTNQDQGFKFLTNENEGLVNLLANKEPRHGPIINKNVKC